MASSQIGIKIADGTFYPVLDEGTYEKKRLVLTTVKDNQENVQIDLYRSSGGSMEEADYVGSLIIENITPAPGGEPEVEVILGIDEEDTLNAIANDRATGNKQSLSTSLQHLSEQGDYTIPDFELDEELSASEEGEALEKELTGTTYPIESEDRRKAHLSRGKNRFLRVIFIIIGLLIITGIAYVLYRVFQPSEPVEPLEIGQKTEQTEPASSEEKASPGEKEESVSAQTEEKSTSAAGTTASEKTETTAEEVQKPPGDDGAWYTIKWGDTLWDISATYYRNPWMYPTIAEHPKNGINDPDFILAGFKLFIPKK